MQAMETGSQPSSRAAPGWQFWIDRGGTFTDVIGMSPRACCTCARCCRAPPAGGAGDPGLAAARAILAGAAPGGGAVGGVKVGTTVATNALLTRSGEPVLLVTTAGFADALRIGYQNRPDIFARQIVLPKRLYASVLEAHERIDAQGEVLAALDLPRLRADLARARAAGRRAVAIVFLHGWRSPAARAGGGGARARARLRGSVGVARAVAAGALRDARGYHRAQSYLALPLRDYVDALAAEVRTLDPARAWRSCRATADWPRWPASTPCRACCRARPGD